MIGDTFKNYKNIYTEIKQSESEIDKRWQMLSDILPEQHLSSKYHFRPYSGLFVSTFVVLLLVTIGLVQAAKPGSLFYPVHTVTQDVAKGITNIILPKENHVNPPKIHMIINSPTKLPTPTNKRIAPTPTKIMEEKQENSQDDGEKAVKPTIKVLGTQTEIEVSQSPTQSTNEKSDNPSTTNTSQKGNNHAEDTSNKGTNAHSNNGKNDK